MGGRAFSDDIVPIAAMWKFPIKVSHSIIEPPSYK